MELLTAQLQVQPPSHQVSTSTAAYDACPCKKFPVPCHLDERFCSAVPYNQQLQVHTDIEYEMDTSLFEGLGDYPGERALMVALQDASDHTANNMTSGNVYYSEQTPEYHQQSCNQNYPGFSQAIEPTHTAFVSQANPAVSGFVNTMSYLQSGSVIQTETYGVMQQPHLQGHSTYQTGFQDYQRTVPQHPLLQNYNNQLNNQSSCTTSQMQFGAEVTTVHVQDSNIQNNFNQQQNAISVPFAGAEITGYATEDSCDSSDFSGSNRSTPSLSTFQSFQQVPNLDSVSQDSCWDLYHQHQLQNDKSDSSTTQCDILEEAAKCFIEDISESGDSRPPSVTSFSDEFNVEDVQRSSDAGLFEHSVDFDATQNEANICSIVEPVEGQDTFAVTKYRFVNQTTNVQEESSSFANDEDALYLCPEDFDDLSFCLTSDLSKGKDLSMNRSWQMVDVSHSTAVRFSPEQRAF